MFFSTIIPSDSCLEIQESHERQEMLSPNIGLVSEALNTNLFIHILHLQIMLFSNEIDFFLI